MVRMDQPRSWFSSRAAWISRRAGSLRLTIAIRSMPRAKLTPPSAGRYPAPRTFRAPDPTWSRFGSVRARPSLRERHVGKPFVINSHGRLVFPSNFIAELDFSVLETEEQLSAVVRRDFEAKSPTGEDILEKAEAGGYGSRYEVLRDVALNLFWANRYAMTMYDKRPTRWRDVPRRRDDVFLPTLTPWRDGQRKVAAVASSYASLPPAWDAEAEERIHSVLFPLYRDKLHHASELPAVKRTVAEAVDDPETLTFCISSHEPDFPVFAYQEILDCSEAVPELEALHRMAMVLHNQYPWRLADTRLEVPERI